MFVGLDRYMGIDTEKPPKKKSEKKKTTKKIENIKGTKQNKDPILPATESKTKVEFEKPESFSFVTIHLKCPSCKKFTKILKKPQSFTPTESDLICPKCGGKLKTTKK